MIYYLLTFLSLLLLSCESSSIDQRDVIQDQDSTVAGIEGYACPPREEMWICYNPGTKLHDLECEEGCLDPGDPHSFCWKLHYEDCTGKYTSTEWQSRHCPSLFSDCD